MSLAPLILISPILFAVAYCDLRFMRIPNVLSVLILAIFLISSLILPPDDLPGRIVVAAAVFGLGFAGFCFRMLGGGDVKILSALMLFVPLHSLALFAYILSAALLVGIAAILTLRRRPLATDHGWKSISGSTRFPMGISIALAGIIHPLAVMAFQILW